jgi:hypothetical protein
MTEWGKKQNYQQNQGRRRLLIQKIHLYIRPFFSDRSCSFCSTARFSSVFCSHRLWIERLSLFATL